MNKKLMAIAFTGLVASSQLGAFSPIALHRVWLLHRFNDSRIMSDEQVAGFTEMKLSVAKSLSGVDLKEAALCRANLRGADLSNADLSSVDLLDVLWEGTVLSNTNFAGAKNMSPEFKAYARKQVATNVPE